MALNWYWKNKCGKITFDGVQGKYSCNLYQGNALLIMVSEWKEEGRKMYAVNSFFVDEKHMKDCLADDIFETSKPLKLKLNINRHSKWQVVVKAMLKKYPKMKVELVA